MELRFWNLDVYLLELHYFIVAAFKQNYSGTFAITTIMTAIGFAFVALVIFVTAFGFAFVTFLIFVTAFVTPFVTSLTFVTFVTAFVTPFVRLRDLREPS